MEDVGLLALVAGAATSVFSTQLTPIVGIPLVVMAAFLNLASWKFGLVEYLALLFLALTGLSSIWTVSSDLTSQLLTRTAGAVVLFIALRAAMNTPRSVRAVAVGYLAGCAIALYRLARVPGALAAGIQPDSGNSFTIDGLNANYLSYALAAGAAALGIYLTGRAGRTALFVYPLGLAFLFWGIGLTGSRGAMIGIVSAACWWLVPGRMRPRLIKPLLYGSVVVCIAVSMGAVDSLFRVLFPARHALETGDLNGRLTIWPLARHVFDVHMLAGAGAGSFPDVNPTHVNAHNAFLDVASGLGLMGLVVYICLLGAVLLSGSPGASILAHRYCLGSIVLVLLPPLCSGYWYMTPAIWVILALGSRLNVAVPATDSAGP